MVEVSMNRIEVGGRPDGTSLNLVFWQAGKGEPKVFIAAAVHGNELTGVASLWMLREFIEGLGRIEGSLTVLPIINPEGFSHGVRGMPETLYDLNRLYPGDPRGSVAERIVYHVWEAARQHDYVIDLHTAGTCIPFILLDPSPPARPEARRLSKQLAWSSGITVLDELPPEKYSRLGLQGSLPAVAVKNGIPSFTLELPSIEGYMDRRGAVAGFKALKNILRHLGLVRGKPESIDEYPVIREENLYRDTLTADTPGILDYTAKLGSMIPAGALVARIRNPIGDVVDEVRAPRDLYVVALNRKGVLWSGGRVATVAFRKHSGISEEDPRHS